MGSDDVSETGDALQQHLQHWGALGFDTSTIELESSPVSTSSLEEIERIIQSALSLRQRMLPFRHHIEVDELLQNLQNPMLWEAIQDEFQHWSQSNAPWESNYNRTNTLWSVDEESQSRYEEIISACASLDESSWASLDLLLPLLSDPQNYAEIIMTINGLSADEERQKVLLDKAMIQLKEKGFDLDLNSMNLIEQFNELERFQDYSNQLDLLRLNIQSSILPFDPILAETFEKRTNELIGPPSDAIKTIEDNVKTISEHLQTRLQEMNALLREWNVAGFSYEGRSQILPSELLEWEHILPEVEQQYHRHAGALERWKEIMKLWNIQDSSIEGLAGKIEHTDAFLDKIEELEQQWTQKELQGASLIEQWEQFGFEMDVWRYKITQDPRQGFEELQQQVPVYERANNLLDKMLQLDTSLGGEEEVERRSVILRTMDLENDLLDEMEDWIERRTVRNTRHRRMLQSEWEEAVRNGKADANKTFSDLYSFEEAIASLEQQHHLSKSASTHALERSKTELLRLEERGWNITELLNLHEKQSDAFFHQFSQAMDAITRIQSIQRRISGLDWRRDPKRADELAMQVRNPLELVRIEQQIPAFIRHLAERPIEDEAYTFLVWLPKQRPVLLPREQSLIRKEPAKVQPQSTLEEAHEAILEAMDHDPATVIDEATPEEAEVSPEHEVEIPNFRKRSEGFRRTGKHPKYLEAMSDEEFFADDKWSIERWSWWREKYGEKEQIREDGEKTALTTPIEEVVDVAPPEGEEVEVVAPTSTSVVEGDLTSYERLLRLIGLTEEADILAGSGDISVVRRALASHVGTEPRDVRVDRLLRLILRLLPQGDQGDRERSKMIDAIGEILPKYNQWVRMRLEARHMGASGTFFEDAIRLGTALQRVPGPGVRVPLHADAYPLPEPSNLNELHQQTERLIQSMHLPAAGGIN